MFKCCTRNGRLGSIICQILVGHQGLVNWVQGGYACATLTTTSIRFLPVPAQFCVYLHQRQVDCGRMQERRHGKCYQKVEANSITYNLGPKLFQYY